MRRKYFCVLASLILITNPGHFDRRILQEQRMEMPAVERANLVIAGGHKLPKEVYETFFELVGGKEKLIVVIPTASCDPDDMDHLARLWMKGARNLKTIHTTSRCEANNPQFSAILERADGVWLTGGDQERLANAYRGTLVHKRLIELLNRGGVIGGTSAGAAVMTRVMIAGERSKCWFSNRMRPVPGEGFGFLPGGITDQHSSQRYRGPRMKEMLSNYPHLYGLAVDERTAAVVRVEGSEITACAIGYHKVLLFQNGSGKPLISELKRENKALLAQE